jgi:5-methylcytosine-specific restriction endonuclease McrA
MGYTGDNKRAYDLAWRIKRRQQWFDQKGPCAVCGSEQELEVDHIDPATKDPKLKDAMGLGFWSWSKLRLEKELEKCQVLCKACHLAKTIEWQNSRRKHGQTLYGHGCRCEICYTAQQLHNARRYSSTVRTRHL